MKKRAIIFFVISVVIGIVLVVQASVTDGQRLYTSRKAITEYETMIASEMQTIENINKQIEETEALLYQYKLDKYNEQTTIVQDNIVSEYEKYRRFAGDVAVVGPGVQIVVDDGDRELFYGEDINNLLVHDLDILMIINDLRRCGAEAISVNGQRIVDSTSINCSGWTIRINGETYARPFVIRAIGDGALMVSSLLSPEGYGTSLKEWGVLFSMELKDEIKIDAYDGSRYFRYAKTAEAVEGEE